jgi:hypothetical protein
MNWGATADEQRMTLPGDELLPDPSARFTRAITIHAPQSRVWPWIVQIGQDRAGFYSNTWLENLTGADIHNADAIHPEWQRRAVGDRVPLARPDIFGGRSFAGVRPGLTLRPACRSKGDSGTRVPEAGGQSPYNRSFTSVYSKSRKMMRGSVVHISNTNPDAAWRLPYFRGKAVLEEEIRKARFGSARRGVAEAAGMVPTKLASAGASGINAT